MIRKLKIKFVVIIMLILTIIFSSIFAGLYIFQKRQIYNDSIAAMQEAIKNDTKSGLFAEIFGIEAKSSSFPYFNTFVLEVDKVSNTVTAIGFEDELDNVQFERLRRRSAYSSSSMSTSPWRRDTARMRASSSSVENGFVR